MLKKVSKVGLFVSILYLLLTGYFFYEAFMCVGMYCGFILVLPIMPWNFLLDGWVQGSWFVYAMLLFVNFSICYSLGHFFGFVARLIFSRNSLKKDF